MPTYFFDLCESGLLIDEEGQDCENAELAMELAADYARDIAAEQVRKGRLHLSDSISVRTELGTILATIRFKDSFAIDG